MRRPTVSTAKASPFWSLRNVMPPVGTSIGYGVALPLRRLSSAELSAVSVDSRLPEVT